jgi:hypothetical protein
MLKSEGTSLYVEKHIPLTPSDLIIWRIEKGSQCNLSFEYYCRVVTIMPSKSLSRMSRNAQAQSIPIFNREFLGDWGGVTRLGYPTTTQQSKKMTNRF